MDKIAQLMAAELPAFMDASYRNSFMWYLESSWSGRHLAGISLEDFENESN